VTSPLRSSPLSICAHPFDEEATVTAASVIRLPRHSLTTDPAPSSPSTSVRARAPADRRLSPTCERASKWSADILGTPGLVVAHFQTLKIGRRALRTAKLRIFRRQAFDPPDTAYQNLHARDQTSIRARPSAFHPIMRLGDARAERSVPGSPTDELSTAETGSRPGSRGTTERWI